MAAKKAAKSNTKKVKSAKPASKSPAKSLFNKAAKQVAKKISSVISAKPAAKKAAAKPAKPMKAAKVAKPAVAKVAAKKALAPVKAPVKPAKLVKAAAASKVVPAAKTAKLDPKAIKAKGKIAPVIEVEVSAFKAKGKETKGKKTEAGAKVAGAKVKEVRKKCREPACDNDPILVGYCRMHYIKNWRKVKRKEAILATGQLNNYVEELVSKYPDKYLDVIRQDLSSEKDWSKVVVDLELESGDDDLAGDDETEVAAEGVRRDRDFDDDNDSF